MKYNILLDRCFREDIEQEVNKLYEEDSVSSKMVCPSNELEVRNANTRSKSVKQKRVN